MTSMPMIPSTQPASAIHCQSRATPLISNTTHTTSQTAVPATTGSQRSTSRAGSGGGEVFTVS